MSIPNRPQDPPKPIGHPASHWQKRRPIAGRLALFLLVVLTFACVWTLAYLLAGWIG
jgi:hypothetical protein